MRLLLGLAAFGATLTKNVDAVCPKASAPVNKNRAGCDQKQLAAATYQACQTACCADSLCVSWNWDSNLTTGRPPPCKTGGGCCWLKACDKGPGAPAPACPAPGCTSFSGTSGRPEPPAPPPPPLPPPPAPVCPSGPGKPCFFNHGTRPGVTASYDCEMRKHAYDFAQKTLPSRGSFKSAFDALQLQACDVPTPAMDDTYLPPTLPTPTTGAIFHVDAKAVAGGDGSKAKPFHTLEAAVIAATAPGPKTILLAAGKYYTVGVTLTTAHSDLTIQNDAGAEVIISGAVPVANTLSKWSVVNKQTNTWKLDTKGQSLPEEFGMRVGTRRAIRAKFPNGDPETAAAFCNIPLGSIASPGVYYNGSGRSENYPAYFPREHENISLTEEWWAHPSDWPDTYWHNDTSQPGGIHPQSIGGYGPFFYAAGGVCSGRTPAHGYWCSSHNPRGSAGCVRAPKGQAGSKGFGGEGCAQHNIDPPGGFVYGNALPQAAKYKNPKGAIVHARGGSMPYFSYMCLVSGVEDGKVMFDPAVGCDQGGPTPTTPGKAWDWYIENVKEECDSPGEYFYDAVEEALYYTFNATEAPTGHEELSLTRTKVIFNISGTMAAPVKNIKIQGLTIRDAAFTYLGTDEASRHWLPSEGDWALQRSGAVTIEGAEGVAIHQNQITRCDGNGVFLGGYTRGVNITGNDMNYIGDSPMAAFGWTSPCLHADCKVKLPNKVGPDGRGGEQPRGSYVAGNLIREFGIWQKQSSAWFQALAALTTFNQNVVFNGPRAAVNFNDAFGGGNKVIGNLMFNQVRETVDHGTLNSWERGPYFSDIGYVEDPASNLTPTAAELDAGATPGFKLATQKGGSTVGQYTRIANNFLLGTYNVNSNLETDDGSSRYLLYNNYFVYSTHATDYAMNARYTYHVNNVHAYGEGILAGWSPGNKACSTDPAAKCPKYLPPATNCYVYNATFYMLGEGALCSAGISNTPGTLDSSVIHTNATSLGACVPPLATAANKLAAPASDAAVTAAARAVMGDYPKPYDA